MLLSAHKRVQLVRKISTKMGRNEYYSHCETFPQSALTSWTRPDSFFCIDYVTNESYSRNLVSFTVYRWQYGKMAQKRKLDYYDDCFEFDTESLSSFESDEDLVHSISSSEDDSSDEEDFLSV
ncbi:hypothetical protein TNIN_251761 [Trichonephila inaurata madagascariensis]|uniref:Uncharacterized protein n=1 Tax=Trichonephila inaurata madagascariensis TaxID=2747483 RepID=A0A8X6YP16_9ARAC|nr:hypothetical protein TNIN_251761 [Trichonephila inaurata madagascariensis]